MSLFDVFRCGADDTEQSGEQKRPEKPPRETYTEQVTKDEYKVTIHYRNGDIETRRCFGVHRDESQFEMLTEVVADDMGGLFEREDMLSYDREVINYETLSREPIAEQIGSATFAVSWLIDYEWELFGHAHRVSETWIKQKRITDIKRLSEAEQ